jgi:hypothetical protein
MEIFDYLKNVLFFKKPYKAQNIEETKSYNIFLMNRWISMFDGECANLINETTNKVNYLSNDREMHYKALLHILPKSKFKKIEYIKKPSKEE